MLRCSSLLNCGSCWPGSKMNGIAASCIWRACDHIASRAVGRDDAYRQFAQVAARALGRHFHLVRVAHRAGVEGGDLVVVAVGRDVALRGVQFGVAMDQRRVTAPALDARQVFAAVHAQSAQDHRLAAQQMQVVGDVAGAAAPFAAQRRHQEADVQDVHLVRQDLVGKAAGTW